MITIKPHHLMDIIKLYGSGIVKFVPDDAFQHDFYKIGNTVINNIDSQLQFTIYADDICKPCNRLKYSKCSDLLDSINGYTDKNNYNQTIDTRLINILKLDINDSYSVKQFLEIINNYKNIIFDVWIEEDSTLTKKRNELFWKGLEKLLV